MKITKLIIFGMIALNCIQANAQGYGAGNGGGVHYCPGRKVKVEFYDLYEAREVWNKNIPTYAAQSVDEILESALNKIEPSQPAFARKVRERISAVKSMLNYKEKKKLTRVQDADVLMVDEDCSYEQLANWHEPSNNIFIDQKYYKELEQDNLGVAALILHEAVYKQARVCADVTNSNDVRKFVGEALSTSPIQTNLCEYFVTSYGLSVYPLDPEKGQYVLRSLFKDESCEKDVEIEVDASRENTSSDGEVTIKHLFHKIAQVPDHSRVAFRVSDIDGDKETTILSLTVRSKTCSEVHTLTTKLVATAFAFSVFQ